MKKRGSGAVYLTEELVKSSKVKSPNIISTGFFLKKELCSNPFFKEFRMIDFVSQQKEKGRIAVKYINNRRIVSSGIWTVALPNISPTDTSPTDSSPMNTYSKDRSTTGQ